LPQVEKRNGNKYKKWGAVQATVERKTQTGTFIRSENVRKPITIHKRYDSLRYFEEARQLAEGVEMRITISEGMYAVKVISHLEMGKSAESGRKGRRS
jgi:hypothetical protein